LEFFLDSVQFVKGFFVLLLVGVFLLLELNAFAFVLIQDLSSFPNDLKKACLSAGFSFGVSFLLEPLFYRFAQVSFGF
jgi:hypothetical protein